MLKNKKELKGILALDRKNNLVSNKNTKKLYLFLTRNPVWFRWKFIKHMRYVAFYKNKILNGHKFCRLRFLYHSLFKNKLAMKLNYEIGGINIGPGITLCHNGPIVIHGSSTIGKNCVLHGDNCIGNNGITDDCPVIGDDVDIGVGAKIIGGVKIANRVKIGAGAVVVKDVLVEGCSVGGVPAKIINGSKSDKEE